MPSAPDIDTDTRYPLPDTRYPLSIPCQMFLFPFFNLLMWIVFLLFFFTAPKEWFFLLLYTLPLLDQRGNFSRLGWKQGSPHLRRLWKKKQKESSMDKQLTIIKQQLWERFWSTGFFAGNGTKHHVIKIFPPFSRFSFAHFPMWEMFTRPSTRGLSSYFESFLAHLTTLLVILGAFRISLWLNCKHKMNVHSRTSKTR